MNDQPTQNTDGTAPVSEDSGNTDLDELLREFTDDPKPEAKVEQPVQPDIGKLLKGLEPVVRYVEEDRRKKARAEEDKILNDSVTFIKENESLTEVDEELVQGFLMSRYSKDAEFRSAFDNRGTNEAAWSKALEGARDAMAKKITGLPGNKVRSDVEAAQAAVDGASGQANIGENEEVSVADMQAMSDVEFRQFKQGLAARG